MVAFFIRFIYLGFYIVFNTVQVISRQVVRRSEETSAYSWSRFCTVNCRPMASKYQLSHLRLCREPNPGLRGGRLEYYHSATTVPGSSFIKWFKILYTDSCSCVIFNRYLSEQFRLSWVHRQGDPLSPYIFILAIEQ